jgi:uncharacterized SAM-dependent methyltransferase
MPDWLQQVAQKSGTRVKHPINAPGDHTTDEEFERNLLAFCASGFRNTFYSENQKAVSHANHRKKHEELHINNHSEEKIRLQGWSLWAFSDP